MREAAIFHMSDFGVPILRVRVEKLWMDRKNFLLGCGQTVESKIGAVYCVKNTCPQVVCKSVDNSARSQHGSLKKHCGIREKRMWICCVQLRENGGKRGNFPRLAFEKLWKRQF